MKSPEDDLEKIITINTPAPEKAGEAASGGAPQVLLVEAAAEPVPAHVSPTKINMLTGLPLLGATFETATFDGS